MCVYMIVFGIGKHASVALSHPVTVHASFMYRSSQSRHRQGCIDAPELTGRRHLHLLGGSRAMSDGGHRGRPMTHGSGRRESPTYGSRERLAAMSTAQTFTNNPWFRSRLLIAIHPTQKPHSSHCLHRRTSAQNQQLRAGQDC